MFFFTLQDRKRQFEIQKLQRENQKQHSVLQRKSEEVYVGNFFRIIPEFRILRLTFHGKSASKC